MNKNKRLLLPSKWQIYPSNIKTAASKEEKQVLLSRSLSLGWGDSFVGVGIGGEEEFGNLDREEDIWQEEVPWMEEDALQGEKRRKRSSVVRKERPDPIYPSKGVYKSTKGRSKTRGKTSPNQSSKAKKKRRPNKSKLDTEIIIPRRVGCYCICRKFNMDTLRQFIRNQYELERFRDVLHFRTMDHTRSDEDGNIFVFPYGVLVMWNMSVEEEMETISELKPFCEEPLPDVETDQFDYFYWDKPPEVKNDEFFLSNDERYKDEKVKVAISHGIAQSMKLSVFEDNIDDLIDDTKQYPLELASHGEISMTRKEIFKKMGQLWLQKNDVNLHSDILDTPEFFFENPTLLPLFEATVDYLDIKQRVKVLNSRLDVVGDMFQLLTEEVHAQHGTRLEWIVILLIVAEVVLELLSLGLNIDEFFQIE